MEPSEAITVVEDDRTEAERAEDALWIENALDRFRELLEWLREH